MSGTEKRSGSKIGVFIETADQDIKARVPVVKGQRIEPPGITSYETIDAIFARLDETLTEVAQKFSLNPRQSASTQPSYVAENWGFFNGMNMQMEIWHIITHCSLPIGV